MFGELSLNCECSLLNGLHLGSLFSQAFGQPYIAAVVFPYLPFSVRTGWFCVTVSRVWFTAPCCFIFSCPAEGVPCLAEKLKQSKPKLSVCVCFSYCLNFFLLWIENSNPKTEESCIYELYSELDAAAAIIKISLEANTMCYPMCIIYYIEITYYAFPWLQTQIEGGAG